MELNRYAGKKLDDRVVRMLIFGENNDNDEEHPGNNDNNNDNVSCKNAIMLHYNV